MNTSEEKKLVRGLLKGSEEALRKFYDTYQPKLQAFISGKFEFSEDVEEIVQDTLLSALDSLALFSQHSKLSTWVYSIARHEVADYYRRKRIKTIVFSKLPVFKKFVSKALEPDALLLCKEYEEKVKLALEKILPHYRRALELKYMDGMSVKNIAEKMGMSLKAVESVLIRAKKAFEVSYEKQE